MVKPSRTLGAVPPRNQYQIGISDDIGVDALWNPEDDKFKVLCRMVHVTKAALHIGYVQLFISFVFSVFFGYHYLMAVSGSASSDHWINQYTARYVSQLLFAVGIQLVLVVVMIHGIRSERRAFLLPYIVFAAVAILAGCVQLGTDFVNVERESARGNNANTSQFVSHLIATMIHAWCLSVIWRAYGYLGEKKVARQISDQLNATHAAFHYPDQFFGYVSMPQPPPYADTVVAAPKQNGPTRSIIKMDEDKQPLNIA